jgi:thiol-disulfide isomerase/thioredoxin
MSGEGWRALARDWGAALGITVIALLAWQALAPGVVTRGPAPTLSLPNVDGTHHDLEGRTADAYVVNFWATWCAPCIAEIPSLTQFHLAHPEVELIGVSVDDQMSTRTLRDRVKGLKLPYIVVHDLRATTAAAWGVHSYPTTFVLDRNREIVAVHQGQIERGELERMLDLALPD